MPVIRLGHVENYLSNKVLDMFMLVVGDSNLISVHSNVGRWLLKN